MSPTLNSLYWLPIPQRVTYKIALLVWKYVHGAVPAYLQEELCVPIEGAFSYGLHLLNVFSYRG